MHLDLEGNFLAGKLGGMIVFREGDVDVFLLAGAHADDLLLKTGDEGAGAENQLVVFTLPALESNSIQEAFKVDDHGVAVLGGALDGADAGDILRHAVDLGVHFALLDLRVDLLDLNALVLAEGDGGIEVGDDGQGDGIVIGNVHIGNAGTADGLHILRHDGFLIDLREHFFNCIFKKDMLAVSSLDDHAGRLALAEAGDGDVLAVLEIRLVDGRLQLGLGQLHGNGCFGSFFFYAFNIHLDNPPMCCAGRAHFFSRIRTILSENIEKYKLYFFISGESA